MIRSFLSNLSSVVIALLFAIIVWIVATNEENPTREGIFAEALPITFINPGEGLTLLSRSANTVRVRIRAPASSWDDLSSSNFQATVDLSNLSSGEHQVPVVVKSTDPRVRILSVDPPSVQARLETIKRVPMPVRLRILDEPSIGYEVKSPQVIPSTVWVIGPQSQVDQVNDVTVEVALRGAKTTIDRQASVILHDAQGVPLQEAKAEPSTVTVHVPIEQRVGYKDVAIKAVIRGNVASGYWISDISVDPPTVTLVGAPDALNAIAGFVETEPLDVGGAKENIAKRIDLVLPTGVSVLSATDVIVRVAVEPVLGGLTVRRSVTYSDLSCNLQATVSPDTVEVILSGPLPILQALQSDDVQIVVMAPRCAEGSYQSELRAVNVPEAIKVESIVPSTAEINLKNE